MGHFLTYNYTMINYATNTDARVSETVVSNKHFPFFPVTAIRD